MRRAKIVCTLGPASASEEVIGALIDAGLNVARLNFSHGTHEDHESTFSSLRSCAEQRGQPVAILQDLQGPKIRVGRMAGGAVSLDKGKDLILTTDEVEGTAERPRLTAAFSCTQLVLG